MSAPTVSTGEIALIGTLLNEYSEAIASKPIAELVQHAPESFDDLRCGKIAVAIREKRTADISTLKEFMGGQFDAVGGIPFLAEAMREALNVTITISNSETALEAFRLRKAKQTIAETAEQLERDPEHLIHIARIAAKTLTGLVDEHCPFGLPEIIDADTFEAERIETPPELVKGLLHQGDKLAIGGGSKSFKTFALLDLGLSVAYGKDWLGMETERGNVCYLNFELRNWSIQKRLLAIESAKGIKREPGRFHIWNLRGYSASYESLIPQLIERLKDRLYALIILDPLYKLLGGADENSARDITALLNALERLNQDTGAAIAFGSHFSKGNQGGKESIDRISGSGVFARDPDSIMTLTRLVEDGAFAAEFTLRNLAPLDKFAVRWNYPLFSRDATLNPDNLKQSNAGRNKGYKPEMLLSAIIDSNAGNPVSVSAWAISANIPRQTLTDYLPEMRAKGWVATTGEGKTARQYITAKGLVAANPTLKGGS